MVQDPEPALALMRDLMMAGTVRAAAQSAGTELILMRDPQALAAARGRVLIVDLNQEGAIEAAGAWRKATGRPVVGFVSHVDHAAIARAREAGIDQVLPRSALAKSLGPILSVR
jgi:hypothetical protein